MRRVKHITESVTSAALSMALLFSFPALAQKGGLRGAPQRREAPAPAPQQHAQAPRPQGSRAPEQGRARQQGHAGDWLRRYKDMPPAEQERALQNDPDFRHLPPETQQRYLQRLHQFSNLPPQKQLQMLNRMETWEHLTPEQKQTARQIRSQMQQLPPDRQRLIRKAIEDMRSMPPDQRESIIDSDRFKGVFSDQERDMIRGATRLPLAPAEGAEATGPQ
jgi:hypothetical protein